MATIKINGVDYEVTESGEGSMAQPMERDISWLEIDPDTHKVIYCKNYNGQGVKLSSDLNGTRENYAATEYAAGLLNSKIEGYRTSFTTAELNVNGNASVSGNLSVTGRLDATANKAIADESGNNIVNTYATKTALSTAIANVTFPKGLDYAYDATKDYTVGEIVFYNGSIYMCLSANGASTTVVTPSTDPDVWSRIPTENQIPSGKNIDELVFSISPLTDSGLKLADGSLVSNGAYHQYYAKKLADYNNADVVANAKQLGSLTNNSGVYSGFSSSNRLILNPTLNVGANTWEIRIKCTTGADVATTNQVLINGWYDSGDTKFSCLTLFTGASNFRLNLSSNASSTDIGSVAGTYTVLPNTTYWLKLVFNGSSYVLSYSLDGDTYTADITISSSASMYSLLHIGIGAQYNAILPFFGSIDFNETSITIDGNLWWQGAVKRGFTNETYWQAMVSELGACGKFVLDSENETIRLPKITKFTEGTSDLNALGDLTEAGLPNAVGGVLQAYAGQVSFFDGVSGVFSATRTAPVMASQAGTGPNRISGFRFDASRSSPIFGNSDTVQTQSISVYVYIVIANAQKTSISVDIDEVMTDVNNLESNKANKDFSNVTDSAKVIMAKASMPSTRYIDLTVGGSDSTYTAPADGYFCITGSPSSAQACELSLINRTANIISTAQNTIGWALRIFIPCSKNDIVALNYSSIFNVASFRFIYAQGAVSEA